MDNGSPLGSKGVAGLPPDNHILPFSTVD